MWLKVIEPLYGTESLGLLLFLQWHFREAGLDMQPLKKITCAVHQNVNFWLAFEWTLFTTDKINIKYWSWQHKNNFISSHTVYDYEFMQIIHACIHVTCTSRRQMGRLQLGNLKQACMHTNLSLITLNLHLVTTTNFKVWSLPKISSLHKMSSWK